MIIMIITIIITIIIKMYSFQTSKMTDWARLTWSKEKVDGI